MPSWKLPLHSSTFASKGKHPSITWQEEQLKRKSCVVEQSEKEHGEDKEDDIKKNVDDGKFEG